MSKRKMWIILMLVVVVLSACGAEPPTAEPPPTTAPPTAQPPTTQLPPTDVPPTTQPPATEVPPTEALPEVGGVYISEVLPGVHGVNNNLEFIELYNAGSEAANLEGWSLSYRLDDGKEEQLVYAWQTRADIPGKGHYLLARAGQDVGNIGDVEYNLSLFEKKGGLALRDADGEVVDTIVWGEGPADYVTGAAAPVPEGGASLERLPGGTEGNRISTGNDATDFVFNDSPTPQNSGDPVTPLAEQRLGINVALPATVEPGSEVAYTVEVENLTAGPISDVHVWLPIPDGFEVIAMPEGASQSGNWVEWILHELTDGAVESATISLQSPWTYLTTLVSGAYVESPDWPASAYGPLLPLAVEGGAIPIGTARTLTGKTVTVEGIATMYTGGFYSGSTGTKFYLEDESGGVQAYCPGAMGIVEVSVGDLVRVTGTIEVYRDSVEIIPNTYPDDVEVLETPAADPEPREATIKEALNGEDLVGRLVAVEGLATRIDEFSYSYEVDLMDGEGNALLLYLDKLTEITTEPLDLGKDYRATGILEYYSGQRQLSPRFQTDLEELFAPELTLEIQARNSVQPGETITYTLTAYNHTDDPLTDIIIEAMVPEGEAVVSEVLDGGQLEDGSIFWTIPELPGTGGSASVRYVVTVNEGALGQIVAKGASTTAENWPELVETAPLLTFVGGGVPIWAIQGMGMTSPYVRAEATTVGTVVGVFPELEGFWIQEAVSDNDPSTSAGLFVETGQMEPPVELGDLVKVSGRIREKSGQTLLDLANLEDLTVLSSGNELPPAFELDPPVDDGEAQLYYEALEGMLVKVTGPAQAVGPTTKYGETPLVLPDWNVERVIKGDPKGLLIFVDDGSSATHTDISTLPFALKTGDTLSNLAGPLAFTYENYKIEPITGPDVASSERPLPSVDAVGPDEFSIATFNVENLFDSSEPNPSDPPIPTTMQYKHDLAKTAATIEAMGAPTIIGFQEVENIGILEDLAAEEPLLAYDYQAYLIEGSDSRGIDVGYLVRGDQATVGAFANYPAPGGLTSRPPLLITTTLHLESGDQTVYVLNNHFLSMSGGELPTEPRRKDQAEWNVTLVQEIQTQDPDAYVVVLGDLNSFYESPPIDVLREAGLRHIYELVEPERPYTYIYEGESETLDHILVTPSLYEHLDRIAVLHINADYPPPIPDDPSARGSSDHDPPIAIFSLK